MPMYDYQCQDCQHHFERNVKIANGHDPQECPECKSMNSAKIPSGFLFGDNDRMNANKKMPEDFKGLLKKIHDSSPGSRMRETSAISF